LSSARAPLVAAETCLFTKIPDEDLVIDLAPGTPRIPGAAGFSGHGFEFGIAVEKALEDLAWEGRTSVRAIDEDRKRFAIARFLSPQSERIGKGMGDKAAARRGSSVEDLSRIEDPPRVERLLQPPVEVDRGPRQSER
jgi:hypothetical protein